MCRKAARFDIRILKGEVFLQVKTLFKLNQHDCVLCAQNWEGKLENKETFEGFFFGSFAKEYLETVPSLHLDNYSLFSFSNGPFAAGGHMVQNSPCWRASCPLEHPEQSDFIKTNLHFLCFGCPSA